MTTIPEGGTTRERDRYAVLLEQFGTGWEQLSAKLMAQVFAEDAVFVPDAFGAPIRGRDAIEAYWNDIPYEQSDVSFRFGEIHVAGPWFATEFKCTFRRRRTGDPIDVRGAMFCETVGDLLSEMRMYWDRTVGR